MAWPVHVAIAHTYLYIPIWLRVRCTSISICGMCNTRARLQGAAAAPNAMEKKKYWDAMQPLLKTDPARVAGLGGLAMNTESGPITSASLADARIA